MIVTIGYEADYFITKKIPMKMNAQVQSIDKVTIILQLFLFLFLRFK